MLVIFSLAAVLVCVAQAALPTVPDCQPAQNTPFDTTNPISLFGITHEIGIKATPQRVGSLRQNGPLPTGHFATNHIKNTNIWPIIQTPYQTLLTKEGAVHDVYTMDRWNDPERTNHMEQQSAWEAGKPWNKLKDMGSGPDGNKMSEFTGKSGVRIGIQGAGEPEITAFGELYANFVYKGAGGQMEVPIVRGAALMSHIMTSADPVVKPYCLSVINGHNVNFNCPVEPSAGDGDSGHIEADCHGSTMTITLHNSKEIRELEHVQWAAEAKTNWGKTYMKSCDIAHCRTEDGGKTVKITVQNAEGTMNYAVNYISHYFLPHDWTHHPGEVSCTSKRDIHKRSIMDISLSATCSPSLDMTIVVDMGPETFPGITKFQYALEPSSKWTSGFVPPMRTCGTAHCQRNGNQAIIRARSSSHDYKMAVNIIGMTTFPRVYWIEEPYVGTCDGSTIIDGAPAPTPKPATTRQPAPAPPPSHDSTPTGQIETECHGSTMTITLHNSEEIRDLEHVQWAAEAKSNWGKTYMRSCDSAHCRTEDGGKTVKITVQNAEGTMNYAVNYIGHYLLPPDWTHHPGEVRCISKRDIHKTSVMDISLSATCSPSLDMTIIVDMGPETFPGITKFQYALEPSSKWTSGFVPPMRTCGTAHCQRNGNQAIIRAMSSSHDYKMAVNIIGMTTFPRTYWLEKPYAGACDGSTIVDGNPSTQPQTSAPTSKPAATTQPTPAPVHHTTPSSSSNNNNNNNNSTRNQPGYTTGDINQANTKFIMELKEPGSDLPHQTRKFILYFSSPVYAKIDQTSQEITFQSQNGGKYSGLVQLAYAGTSPQGDGSQVSFFDKYAGVYSYMPRVRYCVSQSMNKGYVSFEWNLSDATGDFARTGTLLMVAMPHHALLLEKTRPEHLVDTPFTFRGYEGNDWTMEYNVLHTEVDPDPQDMAAVKANP